MSNIRKLIDSHITEVDGKYYVYYEKGHFIMECLTKKAARLVYIKGQTR